MARKVFRVGRSHTGLGLFATALITKGATIVEYSGRRIPTAQAQAMENKYASKYMFEINSRSTIDGSGRSNIGRYANHACRPNTEAVLVKGRIVLRAIKSIRPDEEITFDYGREYFDLFLKSKGCCCATCLTRRSTPRATLRKRGAQ
jgi:SET domain-containing protein